MSWICEESGWKHARVGGGCWLMKNDRGCCWAVGARAPRVLTLVTCLCSRACRRCRQRCRQTQRRRPRQRRRRATWRTESGSSSSSARSGAIAASAGSRRESCNTLLQPPQEGVDALQSVADCSRGGKSPWLHVRRPSVARLKIVTFHALPVNCPAHHLIHSTLPQTQANHSSDNNSRPQDGGRASLSARGAPGHASLPPAIPNPLMEEL
jgi:hypothetical protein